MKAQKKAELLNKYAKNQLSVLEESELEKAIEEGIIDLDELPDHQGYVEYINNPEVQPSAALDTLVYAMLEQMKPKQNAPKVIRLDRMLQVAASIAMLIFTFWGGIQFGRYSPPQTQNNPVDEVANLISTIPVSEKINLIASVDLQNGSNKQIINALLFTLNNDGSNNVRLACIEALEGYILLPEVREGLINSIRNQDSPAVIASLATIIRQGGTSLSQEQLMNMVKDDIPEPMLKTLKTIY